MSGVSAKVILDSLGHNGTRLTTIEVRLHRFVLAELNTHRMFSRNSASSRAIPIARQIESVLLDPAIPLSWGSNKPGMQAGDELPEEEIEKCVAEWLHARDSAVESAEVLSQIGLHKQVVNRLLEPFMWHTVVISSTEWRNFFEQRCNPLAQPEMRAAAEAIQRAYVNSAPAQRTIHAPYTTGHEQGHLPSTTLQAISVARCARVSYMTHGDTEVNIRKDIDLYRRLTSAQPPHWSPLEHVATSITGMGGVHPGNFQGEWLQLRHHFKALKQIERELAAAYPVVGK